MGSSIKTRRGIDILRGPVIEFTYDSVGTYLLILEISKPIKVQIRNTGIELDTGLYIYVGSAFGSGGLSSRIHRHLRRKKKNHWYVDQITMSQHCSMHGIAAFLNEKIECQISQKLSRIDKIKPIKDFGNSDCKTKCFSHFFHLE